MMTHGTAGSELLWGLTLAAAAAGVSLASDAIVLLAAGIIGLCLFLGQLIGFWAVRRYHRNLVNLLTKNQQVLQDHDRTHAQTATTLALVATHLEELLRRRAG